MKFIREVEAIQFTGANHEDIVKFSNLFPENQYMFRIYLVAGLEGFTYLRVGDWLLKETRTASDGFEYSMFEVVNHTYFTTRFLPKE